MGGATLNNAIAAVNESDSNTLDQAYKNRKQRSRQQKQAKLAVSQDPNSFHQDSDSSDSDSSDAITMASGLKRQSSKKQSPRPPPGPKPGSKTPPPPPKKKPVAPTTPAASMTPRTAVTPATNSAPAKTPAASMTPRTAVTPATNSAPAKTPAASMILHAPTPATNSAPAKKKPKKTPIFAQMTVAKDSDPITNDLYNNLIGKYNKAVVYVREMARARHASETDHQATKEELEAVKIACKKNKDDLAENSDYATQLEEDVKEKDKRVEDMRKRLEDCLTAMKADGKACKWEQSQDVLNQIVKYIKGTGYRTTKFARSEKEQEAFTNTVYHGIKGLIRLDQPPNVVSEVDFLRVYKGYCNKILNEHRQSTQTSLYKAMAVWYEEHEAIPTVQEMLYVWLPLPETTHEDYEFRSQLLIWYMDVWLPAAAGVKFYGKDVRYYSMHVAGFSQDGFKAPHVPIQAEALALMLLENCTEKWKLILEHRQVDPKWKVPTWEKDNQETHKYHYTEFSDPRSGQVSTGGWKPDAYKQYNRYQLHFHTLREKQCKERKWQEFKRGVELIRAKNDITTEQPAKKGKKRKNTTPLVFEDIVEFVEGDYDDMDIGAFAVI